MAAPDALRVTLGGGWELLAAGVTRDKVGGALVADVVAQNGRPIHVARLALTDPAACAAFAATAYAAVPGAPSVDELAGALTALAADAVLVPPENAAPKPAQASELIALAADVELFHTPDGKAYATIAAGGHREHWPVNGKGFRVWLAHHYYRAQGRAPGSQALQDAIGALTGRALFDGPEYPAPVRLADHDGAIWLDLGNAAWEAVRIDATGWTIVPEPPVRFRRPRGLAALPLPVAGGTLAALRPFVNCPAADDWRLVLAWLLAACRPSGPYPLLALHGEQGSAKSTTAKVLRALVDPRTMPLRGDPRDERDLAIAANNAWIVAFDNLSRLPGWFSDALCRLATGGGFGTRELYSDDEEVFFDLTRPVLLNGIEDLATRSDLLERSIVRYLPAIPEGERRTEAAFWRDFEAARPALLGALLTTVGAALAALPGVTLDRAPRMADFAHWITAAEPALGWAPGTFAGAYEGNRAAVNDLALDASPVALVMRTFAAAYPPSAPWEGTAKDLLAALGEHAAEGATKDRDWPKTPRALAGALRRYAPNLRAAGVTVAYRKEAGGDRRRLITLAQNTATNDRPDRPDRPQYSTDAADGGTVGAGRPSRHTARPPRDRPTPEAQIARTDAANDASGTVRDGRDGLVPAHSAPARERVTL